MPAPDEVIDELPLANGVAYPVAGISFVGSRKDYMIDAKNCEYSAEDNIICREDYLLDMAFTKVDTFAVAASATPPRDILADKYEVFTASGGGAATPSMLICYDDGVTRQVNWLDSSIVSPPTTGTKLQTISRGVKAFCQYKDRYYASNNSSHIFRITNWNSGGAPPALTVTDLTTVGVKFLLTFRNRMFGITSGGRIYFTDVASIGLYPETWNLTTNFFDLPTVDFSVTVWNARVYKDKIYLFTDKGIYYLAIQGDPTNWVIQPVSSDYLVITKESVCISHNTVFFTDQKTIWAFNGSQFVDISQNLRGVGFIANIGTFTGVNVSLYPYKDGILVVTTALANSAGFWNNSQITIFYYNFKNWVTIDWDGSVQSINPLGIMGAGLGWIPYTGRQATSWIAYIGTSSDNKSVITLDPVAWAGDCFTLNRSSRRAKQCNLRGFPQDIFDVHYIRNMYYYIHATLSFDSGGSLLLGGVSISNANGNVQTGSPAIYKLPARTNALLNRASYDPNYNIMDMSMAVGGSLVGTRVSPFTIFKIKRVFHRSKRNESQTSNP